MHFKKERFHLATILTVATIILLCGCADDPVTTPDSGTIEINQTPDELAGAGWSLSGPQTASGAGDRTLTEMPVGRYTLTWDTVADYIAPPSETLDLAAQNTLSFSGTYVQEQALGTIQINQTPDLLAAAGWSLSGPQAESGSGDQALAEMPAGDYTLTWAAVSGYLTPCSESQTVVNHGTVVFNGAYVVDPGPTSGFVQIPAGVFEMGSPLSELGRGSGEIQHMVTLTRSFEMLATEVTNQQYADLAQWALGNGYCTATDVSLLDALDGSVVQLLDLDDPGCEITFSGGSFTVDAGQENHPVLEVTWHGAAAYCDWLSLQAGMARAYDHSTWECNNNRPYCAQGYRLPTEAEWEYACRAGSGTAFANGEITNVGCALPVLAEIGWYCGNADNETHAVGQLIPNAFGLYDMHGNLSEWCNDWWRGYGGDETDPIGDLVGSQRILRGGTWLGEGQHCRSAAQAISRPDSDSSWYGFRVVRSTQ